MDKKNFVCEICKKKTPKQYEGAEPHTCEECMPHLTLQNCGKFQRKYELWNS